MIAFITMIVNAVVTAFLYTVKAFFSALLWFLKLLFKAVKMLFVFLPVTATVFFALLVFNTYLLVAGAVTSGASAPAASDALIYAPLEVISSANDDAGALLQSMFTKNKETLPSIFSSLWSWWGLFTAPYRGSAAFVLLILLAVLMFVPVHCVFLLLSVFSSFLPLIFGAILADAVLYVVRALFGNHFIAQIRGRMHRLFPKTGVKYEEKEYARNLKQRNREFREEEREKRRHKWDAYYEDEEDEEDGYYEDDREAWDDDYDSEDEEYDEEYEDEDDDEDEDEYDAPPHRGGFGGFFWRESYPPHGGDDDEDFYDEEEEDDDEPSPATSFDFFAGCNSLESVNRKYKSLVKLYHPDNMDGDTAALQEINIQYTEAKKRFR
ncbi:hypothetical protein [Butyrivibrio sp. FCS014]|uniref:hypothetical protein n=1 Tax=Butyrivibrio sp. FCS014 TaxID=1408304 RepID=UPI0004638DE3|nr:hypothetical protein [Butyrivibrio sp. FCS014]